MRWSRPRAARLPRSPAAAPAPPGSWPVRARPRRALRRRRRRRPGSWTTRARPHSGGYGVDAGRGDLRPGGDGVHPVGDVGGECRGGRRERQTGQQPFGRNQIVRRVRAVLAVSDVAGEPLAPHRRRAAVPAGGRVVQAREAELGCRPAADSARPARPPPPGRRGAPRPPASACRPCPGTRARTRSPPRLHGTAASTEG